MKYLLTYGFGVSIPEYDTGAVHSIHLSPNIDAQINISTQLVFLICSVGGSDYVSVRIGAFIGKTMIRSFASSETNSGEAEEESSELIEYDASLDYLCNLSPHRYGTY